MGKARFTAEIVQGHKGVMAVIVPFDPRAVWDVEPVALDDRREGWLVTGTMNRAKFDGWIGLRWGRHFILLDEELARRAKAGVGDQVTVVVDSTDRAEALAVAKEQAKLTTAPSRRKRPSSKRIARRANGAR